LWKLFAFDITFLFGFQKQDELSRYIITCKKRIFDQTWEEKHMILVSIQYKICWYFPTWYCDDSETQVTFSYQWKFWNTCYWG
jgi:hypothetical protein